MISVGDRVEIPSGNRFDGYQADVIGEGEQDENTVAAWVLRVVAPGDEIDGETTVIAKTYLRDSDRVQS